MNLNTLLIQGLEILQQSDEEIRNRLELYIKEIETFNPVYGLVGVTDTNELIIKHILDSLAPLGIISNLLQSSLGDLCAFAEPSVRNLREVPPIKVADAGSGAGLPGIPLAIALPNCDFTLIERMGRRAGFLLNTKAVLNLSNINIEEKEIEKVEPNQFDLVTFRAFKPIEPKLLKTLFKICKPDGLIAAYKGKKEKIEAEMTGINVKWQAVPYSVPFLDEERNLLIIRKN